ncbi:ATP-binding protein [Maritalea mobilis]|uniref:ATP-binding protein n=1 Tax=Maritalea mobilis TaxID=483324 RepID=UPI001C94A880|nr:ATP-binding protein [Maritalea mobilis]MBY6202455.1 ATP-binding protein [Maritalea mobilis]
MISDVERQWFINALARHFTVTWERDRRVVNTDIYVALLRPAARISQTFGFEKEIPFFLSFYPTLQARSMQAIEQICREQPLAGRIDPTVAFFYSPDPKLHEWVAQYQSENPENRIIVPVSKASLDNAIDDAWSFVNDLKRNLFIRNLFDYKLPLKSDRYFYGREDIVAAICDNVRKSQNSGIFGLRKTGKTSVLLKVQRSLQKAKDVETIFFDCKNRPIRRASCDDLTARIIQEIDKVFNKKYTQKIGEGIDVFDVLADAVQSIPKKKKLCLIFDEIEYISPISPTDTHWVQDFIDFWQALWTIQTQSEKISYVVCGVNPTVCDVDRFESSAVAGRTVQNPMFSIFNIHYLRGLEIDNLRNMIQFFGSRMGLFFSNEAIDYLFEQYGGHPLLTRLACSFQHELLEAQAGERPVRITLDDIMACSKERDAELSAYCGHVVSEIAELYPQEYELLKILAAGEVADFSTLASRNEDIRHIRDYGLVEVPSGAMPRFRIPVVKRYLQQTEREAILADEESRFGHKDQRVAWLKRRSKSIIEDLILLNEERMQNGLFAMYPSSTSLKGHQFVEVPLVENEGDAISFLVHAHKHLVEPADKFLSGGVAKNADFESELPSLRRSFMRLKAYRNKHCHIELNEHTEKGYASFLQEDFEGVPISDVEGGWFKMQRRIMDNIHVALQAEIANL